jgi:hypothetical protein
MLGKVRIAESVVPLTIETNFSLKTRGRGWQIRWSGDGSGCRSDFFRVHFMREVSEESLAFC